MNNVKMKDSGIDWIGNVPIDWNTKRVSNFFTSPKILTNPGRTDVLSLTLNGVIEKDIESNKGLNPESYDTYQVFKKNDLVFKLIDLANYQTSRVGRVWKNGIMSSAYIRLTKKKNTNVDYFFYQFFDLYKRAIFNMLGGNGVRSAINRGDLLKLNIIVPPLPQQTAIANYLDHHTTKIDKEISLLEQKVEKLDEYKQALIYETVTKGLDKNVPMKDSSIEWIRMIPEHWEVKRVSDFFNSPKTITSPGKTDVLSLTLSGVIEKDIENNKGLNPESYDTYQVFKKNDLVFKLIDLANYQTSRVGKVWKDGIMSSAYIRLVKKKNTNIDYFFYQFFDLYKRAIFNMLGGNGVRSAINRGDLLKLNIVVPSQREQQQIANYLDEQCSKIDKIKVAINKKCELLKEYKQSLIYEAVTGKIEIEDTYFTDNDISGQIYEEVQSFIMNFQKSFTPSYQIKNKDDLEKVKKELRGKKYGNKN